MAQEKGYLCDNGMTIEREDINQVPEINQASYYVNPNQYLGMGFNSEGEIVPTWEPAKLSIHSFSSNPSTDTQKKEFYEAVQDKMVISAGITPQSRYYLTRQADQTDKPSGLIGGAFVFSNIKKDSEGTLIYEEIRAGAWDTFPMTTTTYTFARETWEIDATKSE